MDLRTYENLVCTESSARKYVLGYCWKNHQRFCPRCRSRKLYRLADQRRRCARCRYTFHDFSRRWINRGQLSLCQWLRLIKLFELEVSARKMAAQLGVAYNTAYHALSTLRHAIAEHGAAGAEQWLGGEVELDESYFGGRRKGKRGRGAAGKVPVFGILEREGRVFVEAVPNVQAETLLKLTVKKIRRGSLVYINGLEGFWSYAKERLIKYHGISPARFPLYLKELEFRYNHRDQDIFPILVTYICSFVPNLE